MKTVKILLNAIDFYDSSYKFTPGADDSLPPLLEKSFSQFGILHPPIIKEKSAGLYHIVSGRKRLLFVQSYLKSANCTCLVLPQTLSTISTWEIALAERVQKGPLTSIEKANLFQKVLEICSIDQAAAQLLPIMGQPAQTYSIKQLLPLARLEEPIQLALQQGYLDQKAARTLCDLSFRDRLALFDIIDNLNLSVGYQKKFIAICKELKMRNDEPILTILSKPELNEIINSDANLPQKASNMMKFLSDLASPKLAEAKCDFNNFVTGINLPKNVLLDHTQSFETDELTLTLKFNNRQTFIEFWAKLKESWPQS